MGFNNFRLNIFIRVLLISLLSAGFFYFSLILQFYFTASVCAVLLIVTVISLFLYAERSNREMKQFLLAIKYGDYTGSFPETNQGKSFNELRKAFNLIISEFQNIRMEKEIHHQFLQTVVTSIPIGIICAEENGSVVIYNEAAQNLIQLNYIGTLDQIGKARPELFSELIKMKNGQTILYRSEDSKMNLQIKQVDFKIKNVSYCLFSLQNIKNELDFREMESWQKLIRVLTHEIMNSVTPISSLSATLDDLLKKQDDSVISTHEIENDTLEDISNGIKAIRNRSKGLLSFVEHYRNFTRIPQPSFTVVKIHDLFDQLNVLLKDKIELNSIYFETQISNNNIEIEADLEQIEQVLINLVLNAIDAVEGRNDKKILLSAKELNGTVYLAIKDNGTGIEKEMMDKIFIPFFTTKTNGSGIGLSLSRQILLMNRCVINVHSVYGEGSIFELVFNKNN